MTGRWLLLILYAVMGMANFIRGIYAFGVGSVISEPSLPFPALGTSYLVMGVGLLIVGVRYFRRPDRRARRWVRGTAWGYQICVWLIHLLGDRSAYARRLWGRDLILTIGFLLFVYLITSLVSGDPPRRTEGGAS